MQKIVKLLIANRGEIAVRVIRAAKDSGVTTVAIYADQDRHARFVELADEAYTLNGKTSLDTYLNAEKIISIAEKSGANAVHPGYGFLAESADFAEMILAAGLIWIGPPPSAIRLLGDKVSARQIAQKVNAPLTPGTANPVTTASEISEFATEHGLPIAIKAAHGGGGRGLKVVRLLQEIPDAYESATREATASFGRGECFVEKYIEKARHVETQCLADGQGNVVVVSTRDCSLQRRNQKLVEEAPAPFLSGEQSTRLYESSKAILREAGYVGAGTCEFLIGDDGAISFLEVNTRLQVEHPVSEEITGIDLVREQFRIAEGGVLDYGDPKPFGHSIEFRINGEDPGLGFLPKPGPIKSVRYPGGPGIRIDSGITTGDVITGAFDSLMVKLIVTATSREEAIKRARVALDEFEITGLPTVIPFHREVLREDSFTTENGVPFGIHTRWIEEEFQNEIPPWDGTIEDEFDREEPYRTIVIEAEGRRLKVGVPAAIFAGGEAVRLRKPPTRQAHTGTNLGPGDGVVISPMQATVIKVLKEKGTRVLRGERICVLEAMKMEQPILSAIDGFVLELRVAEGDSISSGSVIAVIQDSNLPAHSNEE